jgi:putative drug exporter of the RND superfamily
MRPRLIVVGWVVLAVVLGIVGRGFGDSSQPHAFFVDGSLSMRAHEIAERRFGDEEVLVLMLRGPGGAVRGQGEELATRLGRIPRALVVTPWSGGKIIKGLSPRPGVAALILRLQRDRGESLTEALPPIQERIDAAVSDPVQASVAGLPVTVQSFQDATAHATHVGELIAVPVLLLILLLVFRSVLAAAIPVLGGGLVVLASQGLLTIVSDFAQVDSFALAVVGMLGLALGVDYSLLIVSRYREESARGAGAEAVRRTVAMTSRSILPAGAGLILAGIVASELNPSALVSSIGVAVVIVTALSVVSAMCVVPAALLLLGGNLERWALPAAKRRLRVVPWFRSLSRRRPVVIGIVVVLFVLAAWAPTLNSAAATPGLLPGGAPARVQEAAIEESLGPGWAAPFEVLVDGNGKPVTTERRLGAMVAFQHEVEKIPGVETVAGFGRVEDSFGRPARLEGQLEKEEASLVRLHGGIEKAGDAAAQNTHGLEHAAGGASQLAGGVGESGAGAGLLVEGLRNAGAGSRQLSDGLGRAAAGSAQITDASAEAGSGAGQLSSGLEREQKGVGQMRSTNRLIKHALRSGEASLPAVETPVAETEAQLLAAWQALEAMGVGRSDPEYASAVRAVQAAIEHLSGKDPEGEDAPPPGVHPGIDEVGGQLSLGRYLSKKQGKTGKHAGEGLDKLVGGAESLEEGLARMTASSERLTGAVSELSAGGRELSPAVVRLTRGTEHLQSVLVQLGGGAGSLARGLSGGSQESVQLTGALRRIGTNVKGSEGDSQLAQVQKRSPGLFKSGYFMLAAFDGSRHRQRQPLGFLVGLEDGGMGARMLVIPRSGLTGSDLGETRDRLQEGAESLAQFTGTKVAVGGLAGSHLDIDHAYDERIPLTRLALALVTMLVLLYVIRSLLMAVIASLINLLTVAATLGLLSLLFDGSFLGGPGYVDTVAVLAVVMLTFGLATDYETFVFARMREEYERTGSPREAVDGGLDRVAPVITGAAVTMIAVFLAFSVSSFSSTRNLGIGLAIGVFIDAFVVRLILIPAVMHLLGPRVWRSPASLVRASRGRKAVA